MPNFNTESHGVSITFASLQSPEALLDFLVATIKTRDLRTRSILVLLWSQYIQQFLIACDVHSKLLHFVINTAMPPVLKSLTKSGNKAEMLANNSGDPNEGGQQSPPLRGDALNKKKTSETPKIMVKPLIKNLEMKIFEKPATAVDVYPSPIETPSSRKEDKNKVLRSLPEMDDVKEDTESDGWRTPPESVGFDLTDEMIRKLDLILLERKPPTRPKNLKKFLLKFPDVIGNKSPQLNLPCHANGSVPDLNASNRLDVYPSPTETPSSRKEDKNKVVGSLSEVKEDTESEGWETPPESLNFVDINLDEINRKMYGIFGSGDSPIKPNSSTVASIKARDDRKIVNAQYDALACSRYAVLPCRNILGVPNLNPAISGAMRALEIGNIKGRGLQRFAWPHVSGGNSMVAIGSTATGKTWCFLPSLCQRSHEQQRRRTKDNYGPTSIVVCCNQQQGDQIVEWIIKLLNSLSKGSVPFKGVVTLWEKDNVTDVANSGQLGSVGILVTTPEVLVRLQKHHTEKGAIFDANSVKCLALDNLSYMALRKPDTTMKMINWLTQFFHFRPDKCQLFVTTRLWLDTLMRENLLQHMPDALVVFNDPFEASIYAGASLDVIVIEPGEEFLILLQLVWGKCLVKERIVIVCGSQEDILDATTNLIVADIRFEVINDTDGLRTANMWMELGLPLVLVVSDTVLNKLKIRVDLIIHYSAALSWTRCKFRFSLLYNNYVSDPGRSPGKSVILLHRNNVDQMWLLAECMMWHQLPRPQHYLDLLWEYRRKMDVDLSKLLPCDHMMTYGDCHRRSCRYRHILWKEEMLLPANFPTKGEIHFQVLSSMNPTYMVVRQHAYGNTYDTAMTHLSQELQRHYVVVKNQLPHKNPKIGDMVVVLNKELYERMVIAGLNASVGMLSARQLDSGTDVLTIHPNSILVCHQRFRTIPIQAMEMRLCGIEPENMERIWPREVHNIVKKQFFGRCTNVFVARIEYVISRTIFVKTVVASNGQDLRSFLLSRFRAHEDAGHLDKLKDVVSVAKDYPKD